MIEYVDILDEKGEKTGESLPNKEVHAKGLFHRGAHVWCLNSKGELLLQKRTNMKSAYPNYWTVTAGGHIDAGETSIEAARREMREEIGLDIPLSEFEFIGSVKPPRVVHREDYIDDEFDDVFLVRRDIDISTLKPEPKEVEDVRWLSVAEFEEWTKGNGELLTPHKEEHALLLSKLK